MHISNKAYIHEVTSTNKPSRRQNLGILEFSYFYFWNLRTILGDQKFLFFERSWISDFVGLFVSTILSKITIFPKMTLDKVTVTIYIQVVP